MVELEPVEVVVPELEMSASERGDDGNDARMANLLTIMSTFATRMDQQQQQLSSIQASLRSPMPESGAIPKRREVYAVPQSSCAQDSSIPSVQGLRADAAAAAQAASMVEALDLLQKLPRGAGLAPGVRMPQESRCPGPKTLSLGRAGNRAYSMMSWISCSSFKAASVSLTAPTIRL
jgi:hypothetical protein